MRFFAELFGEKIDKRPARENLGGSTMAVPESPDHEQIEAADINPDNIRRMLEEERKRTDPDNEKIRHLERLLENKAPSMSQID